MESDIDSHFVSFPSNSLDDRKSREEMFIGDIAEWSKRRAIKFGDLIIPKHMYIEEVHGERHNAAWIEHSGKDQDTGEHFHIHHVACDCIKDDDPVTEDINAFDCPVWHNALTERVHQINRENRIQETLRELERLELEAYHDIVLSVMKETLVLDREHPDQWMGNVVSGEHNAILMAEMLHIPVEFVRMYVDILQVRGTFEVEGDTFRLAA
jgi:hypothetical protein